MWCIPPKQNADFVAKMEDVLGVYSLPYDEKYPVICLDEKPYQFLGERKEPISMKAGYPQRIDDEYEWMGTCCIFVMCEPLKGWHHAYARRVEQRLILRMRWIGFCQKVRIKARLRSGLLWIILILMLFCRFIRLF
jgi:hypothetical protein